mmetsp:Transcript_2672/g.2936  ORF Transcript_2672/g.2936 Transcript_2672/m.2936 type:complete len:585 (+) Transcript_2672:43-1797(+)|eukprot:CAMPEP_0198250182 /NCGR_PEP_ID=MMETSP1447-20131203/1470_1 /TAXON_ID=420782 /ORGANISM="Chaetoceros dichaeta, Strain CCMP1751" /LENGTH=584 /DNA_ID=CAMNT_0043934983 /DNA_START=36 /DNA_END=1790 /DNA_ORIENTATION=+
MFGFKGALLFALITVAIFSGKETDANHIGIAFGGGGFKSVADQTALTAGLLAVLMKRNDVSCDDSSSSSSPLANSGLYKNVESISSISGGSWFTAHLAYSITYRKMVEEMARKLAYDGQTREASKIFFNEYGTRFNSIRYSKEASTDVQKWFQTIENVLQECWAPHIVTNFIRTMLEFSKLGTMGREPQPSWYSITKHILGEEINQKTLGSEVQEWAKGKNWNIVTSVTTPSKRFLKFFSPFSESFLWVGDADPRKLSYSTEGDNIAKLIFVPVLFSVVLGNDGSPPAPLPRRVYSVTEKLTLRYKWKGWFMDHSEPIETGMQPKMNADDSFADMQIVGPVAASSAAIGGLALDKMLARTFSVGLKLSPSVGFACKERDPNLSFVTGQKLVDKLWNKTMLTVEDRNTITEKGVCNFVDGGYTDPLGIATALASGADEIFCVNPTPDLFTVQDIYFKSGNGAKAKVVKEFFPPMEIFQGKGGSDPKNFTLAPNNKSVKKMHFETIRVKTVENIYFGIKGGIDVTLHIFSAECDMNTIEFVAGDANFTDIGDYVEDIMATLALQVNEVCVNKMLKALGASTGKEVK